MNSSILRLASITVLLVAATFACDGNSGKAALLSNPGDGDGLDCDWSILDCDGRPPKTMFPISNADAAPLGKWMNGRKWMKTSPWIPREPEVADGPQPQFQIMAINEAHRVRLRKIGVKGFVFAHIRADPNGPKDKRYGIGLRPDLTQDFFIVVNDVDIDNKQPFPDSWKVANWYVMGIEADTERLVRIGNTGGFQWCRADHDKAQRKLGSNFMKCIAQKSFDSLAHLPAIKVELQGRSLQEELINALFPSTRPALTTADMSRQIISTESVQNAQRTIFSGKTMLDPEAIALIVGIFRNISEYPAWMVCGSGCCTADDI